MEKYAIEKDYVTNELKIYENYSPNNSIFQMAISVDDIPELVKQLIEKSK